MHNRRTGVATKYHDGTKHPGGSLMDPRHMFDPMRRPAPYKVYSGLEPVSLPLDTAAGTVAALVAVSSDPGPDTGEDETPTFQDLAGILYYSAGVTRRRSSIETV